MSAKTILLIYLIAGLVIGGLLYWKNRAFQNTEREFYLLAQMLEAAATECLQEYEACDTEPDPQRAVECLLHKYGKDGLLDYMEEDFETLEKLVATMARLALPGEQTRLLACHQRFILLDRALNACIFPNFCKRLCAWAPGPDGFFFALNEVRKIKKPIAKSQPQL